MTVPSNLGLSAVKFRGKSLAANVVDAVVDASVEYGIDQVTELDLTIADPGLRLQASGLFVEGTSVDYADLNLTVAAVEVSGGAAGTGQLVIACRPRVVAKLRKRTGPLVMRRVSPSTFVDRETRAVGYRAVVQPSASRRQVARDVKAKGEDVPTGDEPPSSWSTFRRLAEELGYLCYEVAGVIYFGSPRWLIGQLPDLNVAVLPGHFGVQLLRIPSARRANGVVTMEDVIIERAWLSTARPGHRLDVAGFPGFDGKYLITGSSYDLGGAGPVTMSAATATRIEPKPPES